MNLFATIIFGLLGWGESHHGHGHSHGEHSHSNVNICAVFLHFLGDTLSSIAILITGILNFIFPDKYWVLYVDPICSLIIVIIIVWTSIPLVKLCCRILLQRAPENINVSLIQQDILNENENIIEIHDFHIWQLVDTLIICTMHVMMTEENSHLFNKISEKIHLILHKHGIHNSTIQPEYVKSTLLGKNKIDENNDNTIFSKINRTCRCLDVCVEDSCCSKKFL